MDFYHIVKTILAQKDYSISKLARELNTTPQNLAQRLKRGTFTFDEAQNLFNYLGYEAKVIEKS